MAGKTYYWVDPKSMFGGGEDALSYGGKMPEVIADDADRSKAIKSGKKAISPDQEKAFLASGQISTEKVASKRQLSELDELREEVKILRNEKGEESKLAADNELLLKKLEEGDGSGISQDDLDKAKAESAQADLDRIKELELNAAGTATETLDLVKIAFENIQQGDSKAEIWEKVKEVKGWFK